MHFSHSLFKRLILVNLLAIQIFLIRNVSSLNLTNEYLIHKCRDGTKTYHSKGDYEKNLNSFIRSLQKDNFEIGFRHSSRKDPNYNPPAVATIIYGCRHDSFGPKCRSCFDTAVAGLRSRCKDIVGVIWYDQCFVELSGKNRFQSKIDYENPLTLHNRDTIKGNVASFNKKTRDFLYKLTREANVMEKQGDYEVPVHYAAGETRIGTNKVYAMVQCARYMGPLCKNCLEWSIKELSKCCDGKRGARVLSTVCNLRYELYPFLTTQKTIS